MKAGPGRPKGSQTLRYRVDITKTLHVVGCDPFKILAELAMTAKSAHVRCQAASELCSYIAPKLKSIEFGMDQDKPFSVTLNLGGVNQQTITSKAPARLIENDVLDLSAEKIEELVE
jgi:hypothetical protein